ncbi:MAG: hypothetical protein FJY19_05790 [Bacteroidetes bacterium]|nr:hypothetical protein [Bacteroidota bacterium]
MPWVEISSPSLVLTGMNTTGTSFGKPAFFHLTFLALYLLFVLIPFDWAKRFNLLIAALNLSWMIRNFFLMTICRGGECPSRQLGLYLMALASVGMLLASFFPPAKQKGAN